MLEREPLLVLLVLLRSALPLVLRLARLVPPPNTPLERSHQRLRRGYGESDDVRVEIHLP